MGSSTVEASGIRSRSLERAASTRTLNVSLTATSAPLTDPPDVGEDDFRMAWASSCIPAAETASVSSNALRKKRARQLALLMTVPPMNLYVIRSLNRMAQRQQIEPWENFGFAHEIFLKRSGRRARERTANPL